VSNFSQTMDGNRSFPEKPDPNSTPQLKKIAPKMTPFGNQSAGMAGYGEQGEGYDYNVEAPHGNQKLVDSPFKQNQGYGGQDPKHLGTPAETSIRNVRTADLGQSFGNGKLDGGVEIAGKNQSIPKKFLPGGKAV
jgi:hypothetical protein